TGSEVTRFTVITDRHTHVKMLITSDRLIPDVALVDPLLTVSCPKSVTAASGLDALTHAIEAFISRRANPISDGFAINAMGRIARFFRRAYERGDDLEAREQMLLGALEAGLAFSNASVALVHGMARPIGAYFGIAHGLSNAMLLPHVMEYTFDTATERFAEIARALGEPTDGLSVESAARRAVTAVQQLCRDLSVPTLVAAGVDGRRVSELAAQMAEDALASGSPGNNPRVPTTDEIVALYLRAL
ncbi:MAG: iron-containing alcohol dehydrogenase, partial [Chloroflexi bacterium]|nr:iron-containing alcohol dehydrogenase [Chloroflexota bacterium]